ncbi:nickel pincer cofactor biosynthesis protein LarC [[Phormidium] sp. ETS-05]|uniref:nickel pincer cofactor biosynthesis protein LarC n=1 Tax=[Phormidium] sp. ETS-05 TaxID=222819 RepID=UPI0018EF2E18|nr:nickel pincer cofactor biosynthesis protein LarC [[Phormidium] sp. ETS-05]
MKKIAYLECPTGIAGDMCLGALISVGVPLDYLESHLAKLGISQEYRLRSETVKRQGQQAIKLDVDLLAEPGGETDHHHHEDHHHHHHHHHHEDHHHHEPEPSPPQPPLSQGGSGGKHPEHHHEPEPSPPQPPLSQGGRGEGGRKHPEPQEHHHHAPTRHLPEIEGLILGAKLPVRAQDWSLAVFRQLAAAEAAVHGVPPEQVHFHEVGATDAIVDIVGTCLGLDWLGIEQLYCSPLPTGGGIVRAAHGQMPVPVPAVLKLWEARQVPVYSNGIQRELCTPTGVAIVVALAESFGPPPPMSLAKIGLGAGSRDLAIPNILRLWLGEAEVMSVPAQGNMETVMVLETQIDDATPQAIAYTSEALFAAGALDVFTISVGMKKSRSGILLTVITRPQDASACERIIFQETTTIGIRRTLQERSILHREIQTVTTPLGDIKVKIAKNNHINKVYPEYEDCARLAREHQIPFSTVHRMALASWYSYK